MDTKTVVVAASGFVAGLASVFALLAWVGRMDTYTTWEGKR